MKKVLALVLSLVMVFALAIATPATTAFAEKAEVKVTMNIGHVGGAEHPVELALQEFKKAVEERSNGAVVVNVYGNSVLGGELELLDQVNTGTLTASVELGGGNWSGYDSKANISLLPFMFDSIESGRQAWNNEFGEKFAKEIIEPAGAKVISFWESGMRHMTNNVRPLYTPDDFNKLKMRSSETQMKIVMFDALNAQSTIIAFSELYTAMQNGTVDGQENPLSNIYASSFYEVQKYLSLTNHMYEAAIFIVNPDWWDTVPEEYQQIILEEADNARTIELELNDEQKYLDLLAEKGMEINEIDYDSFKNAMSGIWEDFEKEYDAEWIEFGTKYNAS